jgi:hypothetical protein
MVMIIPPEMRDFTECKNKSCVTILEQLLDEKYIYEQDKTIPLKMKYVTDGIRDYIAMYDKDELYQHDYDRFEQGILRHLKIIEIYLDYGTFCRRG